MHCLIELSPYGKNGEMRMVVETPRGSNIKLEYEPKLRAFTVSRALPLGLVYPYDWGFIPGTKGEDGDPIDALALHEGATYPGVVLPCRALGVVAAAQAVEHYEMTRYGALISWAKQLGRDDCASVLYENLKEEKAADQKLTDIAESQVNVEASMSPLSSLN